MLKICTKFLLVLDGCGWSWLVVGSFGWLAVVLADCGWFWLVVGSFDWFWLVLAGGVFYS